MIELTLPIYYTQEYATKPSKTTLLGMNAYRNWHHFTQNKAKIWFSEIVTSLLPSNPETFTKFHMTYELYYKSTACDGSNVIALIEKFTLDSLKANGVIIDDSIKYHLGSTWDVIEQDKDNPRVVITIIPA